MDLLKKDGNSDEETKIDILLVYLEWSVKK